MPQIRHRIKKNINVFITYSFNILLPITAKTIVTTTPNKTVSQSSRLFFDSNGVMPPNTAAANVSFARSKKNDAIFSFLTLSFSSFVITAGYFLASLSSFTIRLLLMNIRARVMMVSTPMPMYCSLTPR